MSQILRYSEDPLDTLGMAALNVCLNQSCDHQRFFEYLMWVNIINGIESGQHALDLGHELSAALIHASENDIKKICSGALSSVVIRPKKHPDEISITKDILQLFIINLQKVVMLHGVAYATQAFGMSYAEIDTLNKISPFMEYIDHSRYVLALRCSEDLLVEALLEESEEKMSAIKLKMAQECLSDRYTRNVECKNDLSHYIYDGDDINGRSNITLSKRLLARKWLIIGFSVNTVSVELGMTERQCRLIVDAVRESKYLEPEDNSTNSARVKGNRQSSNFIKNKEDSLNASILMAAYKNMGGSIVMKQTCMNSLISGYALYCAIRHDAYGLAERQTRRITPQDGWTLAVDLRANRAYFRECNSCKSTYHCSIDQQLIGEECPFCGSTDSEISAN